MLAELSVKNLALIEALAISFGPGANVLTGETGAGKSILVGALGLLMGRRAGADLVRAGAAEASVEALFILEEPKNMASLLNDFGLEAADEIILRRVIAASGRGRAYLNGSLITQAQLTSLGEELLSVSGQHEQQSLLKPARQLDYLDRFGQNNPGLVEMRKTFQNFSHTQTELAGLEENLKDAEEKRDLYEFQILEIEKIKPLPGEDDQLFDEKNRVKNGALLAEILETSGAILGREPGNVVDKLGVVMRHLEKGAGIDINLADFLATVEECYHQLADAAVALDHLRRDAGSDPNRLEWVDERLNTLAKLKRKYGPGLSDVIERGGRLAAILDELDGAGLDLAKLRRAVKEAGEKALAVALGLHQNRVSAATRLAEILAETLKPLGFPKLEMEVAVFKPEGQGDEELAALGPKGYDRVDFLFSPNPGEGRKPLSKIASGGELSRVMLALKTVLDRTSDQLLVFDEIDSGLGGITAEAVAAKMAELSNRQQVIIITHLPQMAALPGRHFMVAKQPDAEAGRTFTTITELNPQERVEELARMLGGAQPSPEAKALAKKLLQN